MIHQIRCREILEVTGPATPIVNRWVFVVVAINLIWVNGPVSAFPTAGFDEFESAANVIIELGSVNGPMPRQIPLSLVGPARISREDPVDPGNGQLEIATEIVMLFLRGVTDFDPTEEGLDLVTIRESSSRESLGVIRQKAVGQDFPADSKFDVFVEITTPFGVLHNKESIKLGAVIHSIPPFHIEYIPSVDQDVALFDMIGTQVGSIRHPSHFVGEKPSFSVAPRGGSGLDQGDIFELKELMPPDPISHANLGLVAGDDIDALAYGIDFITPLSGLRFSVDPDAVGVAGSAVNTEASKVRNEAHGDEFSVFPLLPTGGSNRQEIDENGDTAPDFPLLISDDVDALTEPPTSFVDIDDDGTPNFPVYFSLAPGSPSLMSLSVSAADILMSVNGGPPRRFIKEADLGLMPDDDVDAFCFNDLTNTVVFSLAPGSPTLMGMRGPADLFGGMATPIAAPPPVFVPAAKLGLLLDDNLNALKCTVEGFYADGIFTEDFETGDTSKW